MAVQYDKTNKLFQVDYQAPFGGIDSTAYASAIDPKNFVDMDAGFIEDNTLFPIDLVEFGATGALVGHYLGFIPLPGQTTFGYIITDQAVYQVSFIGGLFSVILVGSYAPTLNGDNSYFHYIVIDTVQGSGPILYWTAKGWNEIWTTPAFVSATPTLLTNYVGGGILALLQNQLLNLGGFSNLDGSVPNRISWSAPGEYGQFQPYDIPTATGNFAAGFNDLPSVSDIITGFAAIGTVGYLERTQGITQINPTGNGEEPFQFNHLWASELGIGTPFPYTLSQYGSIMAFVTDVGIYTLSLSGLSEIGAQARTYIYKLLNNIKGLTQPKARIVPYVLDSPELTYILAIPTNGATGMYTYLSVNLSSGAVCNLGAYNRGNTQQVAEVSVVSNLIFIPPNTIQTRQINPLIILSPTGGSVVSFNTFKTDITKEATFTFRKEQMRFGFIPTVSKIGFLATLIDPTQAGTIRAVIDGIFGLIPPFPTINIISAVVPPGNGVITNVYSDGVQSLERPQLTIKIKNVKVVEAWYQGTLADFPLI